MRAAAGLNVADVLRIADVADVEDADTAQAIVAYGILDALRAAVEPSAVSLTGDEEKVFVNRHIALRCGAEVRRLQSGCARVRDVPHLITIVVALNRVRPCES